MAKAYTKYQRFNFTASNTPIYVNLPEHDLVIIGAGHSFGINEVPHPEKKLENLLHEVLNCNHLILEGTINSNNTVLRPGTIDYNAIAMQYCNGEKHFLEEGVTNLGGIFEKYGISKELIGLYNLFRAMSRVKIFSENGFKKYFDFLNKFLQGMRTKPFPGLDIEIEDVFNKFEILKGIFPNTFLELNALGIAFSWYSAELREYEILCPKTEDSVSKLSGKKVEIVGAYHVDGLEKRLKGKSIKKPKVWKEFVRGLEPSQQEFVNLIESKIF